MELLFTVYPLIEPLHSLLMHFIFYFLNIHSLPLTHFGWAWLVRFRATRQAPPSGAPRGWQPHFIFPLPHSTHCTFPMQICQRPAAYLKCYARHSLLSPTHPSDSKRLTESRRSAIWLRCFDHKRRHTPPPLHLTISERHKPGNGCAELLTPADFFRWRGSLIQSRGG